MVSETEQQIKCIFCNYCFNILNQKKLDFCKCGCMLSVKGDVITYVDNYNNADFHITITLKNENIVYVTPIKLTTNVLKVFDMPINIKNFDNVKDLFHATILKFEKTKILK